MNETKAASQKNKKEKVGPDGLSKKERRALKVADKTVVVNNVVEQIKPVVTCVQPDKNKEVNSSLSKKERRALKVAEKSDEGKPNQVVKAAKACVIDVKVKSDSTSSTKLAQKKSDCTVVMEEKIDGKAGDGIEGKSKAQLKAERRELQEKQRLAKQAAKETKPEVKKDDVKVVPNDRKVCPIRKSPKKVISNMESPGQVQLFNHLHYQGLTKKEQTLVNIVHPSFIKLGSQYSSKIILGSNARCLALLAALKELINDFVTPANQELCRSLETYLQISVTHLQKCRPFAVSMTNALRHFKVHLTQVRTDFADEKKKSLLQKIVDTYIEDEIITAGTAISLKVSEKISNGDIILTYGCSSLIKKILIDARTEGKIFKVIVVDGRPLLEGREMLRQLVNAGIDCSYTLINAVSFTMSQATKVLLGAHALLANGYVMARTGTAQTALIAKAYNKPVLVCCETYKFSERVQTDSFVYNEIGDPENIVNVDTLEENSPLKNMPHSNSLTPLNLMYDVTPPDLVTAVVTELGFLPCTSVPVILRIKPTE